MALTTSVLQTVLLPEDTFETSYRPILNLLFRQQALPKLNKRRSMELNC
jgi:hypothetical protein